MTVRGGADRLREYEADERDAHQRRNGHRATDVLTELDTLELVTTTPEPLDWLADGVFARGYMTLFGGREKRGKSLVQLALGVAMASGPASWPGSPSSPARCCWSTPRTASVRFTAVSARSVCRPSTPTTS